MRGWHRARAGAVAPPWVDSGEFHSSSINPPDEGGEGEASELWLGRLGGPGSESRWAARVGEQVFPVQTPRTGEAGLTCPPGPHGGSRKCGAALCKAKAGRADLGVTGGERPGGGGGGG